MVTLSARPDVPAGEEPPGASRTLRRLALGWAVATTALLAVVLGAVALADPGGWRGLLLVACWALPLGALALLGWRRPRAGGLALLALDGGLVLLAVVARVAPGVTRSIEDGIGPVRAIAAFVVLAATAALAWRRPLLGGLGLLLGSVLPFLVAASGGRGGGSAALLGLPYAVAGALDLAAATLERRPPGAGGSEL